MDINHTPLSPGAALSRKAGTRTPAQMAQKSIGTMSHPGRTTQAISLSEGQTIRGQVTDLRNHQATITMEDGSQVTARLENVSQLSIGDVASFEVQEINGANVHLKLLPMSENQVAGNAIMKALEEAGLPRNDKNIAVVRELIANQMPINKQSIQLLLRQSYQFKDADLSTLTLMNRHNIPVTEGNVNQFQAYREGENPILTKVLDLSQEIPKLLSELTSENSGEALKVFGKELLSILPQQSAPELFKAPTLSLLSEEERLEVMELLPEEVLSEEVKGAIEDGSASAKAVLSLLPEETLEHPLVSVLEESVLEYQTETGQLSALLTKEELSDFSALLSDFPISEDLKEQIASGEANTGEVMRSLQNALAGATQTQVFELFRSPVFQSILQENIISGWTLNTKELTKEKAVERLYESMQKEMASLERLLKGALPDSEAAASLSEKAQHVQQNMDFMNVLNQFYPYVQLPLQLREQMTHGDLYVFTKKKELAKNKDQISVLLHLDMEQLGPLDIHLSLNKNQVSSAFYVEDRSVQRLLQSNIEELSVALSEKGYQFSSTFSVRERSIDIVKDFIEKDAPVAGVKRYSFDIRA